jgi:hypothetical protein
MLELKWTTNIGLEIYILYILSRLKGWSIISWRLLGVIAHPLKVEEVGDYLGRL